LSGKILTILTHVSETIWYNVGAFPEEDVGPRSRAGGAIGKDADSIAVRRALELLAKKA